LTPRAASLAHLLAFLPNTVYEHPAFSFPFIFNPNFAFSTGLRSYTDIQPLDSALPLPVFV
jgi:hypothetical protein